MSLTDYVKKAIVGTAIAAAVLTGAKASAQDYPTNMGPYVGHARLLEHDFNRDGKDDIFGFRVSKTPKGYKLSPYYNLMYKDKFGSDYFEYDSFEIPEGTCADVAAKGNKVTKTWGVQLLQYPCDNFAARTKLAEWENDGTGKLTLKK